MNYGNLAKNKMFFASFKGVVPEEDIKTILAYLQEQDWSIEDIQGAVTSPELVGLSDKSPDIIVFKAILARQPQSNMPPSPAQPVTQPIVVQATLSAPVDYSSMSVKQLVNEAVKTGFTDENLISLIQEKVGQDIYVAVNKDGSINTDSTKLVFQMILKGGDVKKLMLPSGVSLKKITVEETKTYTLPNGKEVAAKLPLVAFIYYACQEEGGYTKTFLQSLLDNPTESDHWAAWANLEEEEQELYKQQVRDASGDASSNVGVGKKKQRPTLDELLAENNPDNFQPRPQVEIGSRPFPTDIEIRDTIIKHFDLNEFVMLCADLGIDHELLQGGTKDLKAQNLITFIKRGRAGYVTLADLVAKIRKERRSAKI